MSKKSPRVQEGAQDVYLEIQKFITDHRAGALATTGPNNQPHVAIIYCFVEKDLSLYFSTRVESRKYQNIRHNRTVALAFFSESDMQTVQLTGQAERVDTLSVEQEILRQLIRLRFGEPNWPAPPIKMFEKGITNELAIVKITPVELSFGSFDTTKDGRYKPFFQEII